MLDKRIDCDVKQNDSLEAANHDRGEEAKKDGRAPMGQPLLKVGIGCAGRMKGVHGNPAFPPGNRLEEVGDMTSLRWPGLHTEGMGQAVLTTHRDWGGDGLQRICIRLCSGFVDIGVGAGGRRPRSPLLRRWLPPCSSLAAGRLNHHHSQKPSQYNKFGIDKFN
jgi:hypothetical protein